MLYLVPFLFVFTAIISNNVLGPIQVLVQTIPMLIMVAVLIDGFFLSRLIKWEWVFAVLSTFLFIVAIFTKSITIIIFLSIIGLLAVAFIYFSQKKRLRLDKQAI
jgi:hypothetical protein